MNLGIKPQHLQQIIDILNENGFLACSFAFGSRTKDQHHAFSDLDILIRADQALTMKQLAKLEAAFSASEIPIKIDIVDWFVISEGFKEKISKDLFPIKNYQEPS